MRNLSKRRQIYIFLTTTSALFTGNIPLICSMSSSASSAVMKIRVCSYNVLSSALASPTHFTSCHPDDLDFHKRLPRVISKIEEEVTKRSIVCLQEVSHEFTGPLHVFFAKNNYSFVTGLYGSRFSNYMGVALAIPLDKFSLEHVDVSTLSDYREGGWPKAPPEELPIVIALAKQAVSNVVIRPLRWMSKKATSIVSLLSSDEPYMVKLLKGADDQADHWDLSKKRKNMLVFAKLVEKKSKRTFGIATYHMPCAFYAPMVMNIHVEMAARRTQTLSGADCPCILAGDFNLKPGSPEYKLITTGKLDEEDASYPSPKYDVTWVPAIEPMKSAYAQCLGSEPDFTNYSKVRDDLPFVDVLDYIFVSKDWDVSGVKDLPHRDDIDGPLPIAEEPSDHILIASDLVLVQD